jgi:hypothetical protein
MFILRNINESSDDNFEATSLENLDLCFKDSVSINETIQEVYMPWIFNQFYVFTCCLQCSYNQKLHGCKRWLVAFSDCLFTEIVHNKFIQAEAISPGGEGEGGVS